MMTWRRPQVLTKRDGGWVNGSRDGVFTRGLEQWVNNTRLLRGALGLGPACMIPGVRLLHQNIKRTCLELRSD